MDIARGFDDERYRDGDDDAGSAAAPSPPPAVGTDERRMQVRAYNHWVSLLAGRSYPAIADLNPAGLKDFGPYSVLIDFSHGGDDPTIAFLGSTLREECALPGGSMRIADVPPRSLLSRLTDHYLQIIANRAPVGFEAEFVGTRGHPTMYRGILMPFSTDGARIDFVYGVINWKELVGQRLQTRLEGEVAAALAAPVPTAPSAPVWADGPSAEIEVAAARAIPLADRLGAARGLAAEVEASEARAVAAFGAAVGAAHDFAIAARTAPEDFRNLLGLAGVSAQARPRSAVAQLIFGPRADAARLRRVAALLDHAAAAGVPEATFPQYLAAAGGPDALLAAPGG